MPFFTFDFVGQRSLVRGDDFRVAWNWSQVLAPGAAPQPVNLNGWSGAANFYVPGVDVPFNVTPALVDALGNISFAVARSVTLTFPKGEVILSVPLTDGSGAVRTVIRGKVRVL